MSGVAEALRSSMPHEADPHSRTWMGWGVSAKGYGSKLGKKTEEALVRIAKAVSSFEPVSMLVRPKDHDKVAELLRGSEVELIRLEIDDLWLRDTGPVFTKVDGKLGAIDFNFNGWGRKQPFDKDSKVAAFVAGKAGAEYQKSSIVLEGGALEVDGQGTGIICESCVLNNNRNKGVKKPEIEAELKSLLGLEKIIWLPGSKGGDITDGHTDGYVKFVAPTVLLVHVETDEEYPEFQVTKRHLEILSQETDARGRRMQLVTLKAPTKIRPGFNEDEFAAGYVNCYVLNSGVIMPEFGDAKADAEAKSKIEGAFPGRSVVQINIDGIAASGGGIHCTTMNQPAL